MKNIKQISFGIQPATKMFRLNALSGQIIDSILDKRDASKYLNSEYFVNISSTVTTNEFTLASENKENIFHLRQDNIVFKKTFYNSNKHFNFETIHSEFKEIWKETNKILQIKNIRRVGIVCESRFPLKSASGTLLNNLTNLKLENHSERFALHFENIKIAKDGIVPDKDKGDFIKIITDVYDSTGDTEYPTSDNFNINIDVQRYYAPLTNADISDEILKLYNKNYIHAMTDAQSKIFALGLA